jgi:integrase
MTSPQPRFNFTLRAIEALPTPEKKRAMYRDEQVRELGVMVQPKSGHRSYFWFRKVRERPVWKTIGNVADLSLEQARDAARKLSNDRAQWKLAGYRGVNPFEVPREELTFAAAVEEYVKRRVPRSKNPENAERRLRQQLSRDLPAAWRSRRLSEISRAEVIELHQKLQPRKATANAAVRTVRKIFSCAIKNELWKGENPAAKLELIPLPCRKRYLRRDEAWQFFEALKTEPNPDLVDFVKLALWTGARKGDIMSMRWQDLSLDDNRWEVPDPKSDPYAVALVPEAVEVLRARNRLAGSPYVFPSHGRTGHLTSLKERWRELLKRAGIVDLRIHDLRRTLGSWQAAQGASLQIIGKSLGHKSQAATVIYSQLNLDPVRESVSAATRAIIRASRKKPKQPPPSRRKQLVERRGQD